jgi:cell division protein ZapA (FtsZ GTPase activity inhibitor)
MQEVSIELNLANRKYPLKVKAGEAASVQKAAELINFKLQEFENKYGVKDIQDLFAMAALQITTQMIEIESNVTGNQSDIHVRLQELNAMISKALEE